MSSDPGPADGFAALEDAVVELTASDGQVYRFRFGAVVPYAGVDYVVLLGLGETAESQEELLITRLEKSPGGELSFEVAQEEDVIEAVLGKYLDRMVRLSLDAPEEDCCCGHDHGEHLLH